MKALRYRIQQAATAQGVGQVVVERDYAQSYVLLGIATTGTLRDSLVFKGGTALKKAYFGRYRFSEDLDFSMLAGPKGEELEREVRAAIGSARDAARRHAPIEFAVERHEERDPHPGGQEVFIVRVQFPWQRSPMVPVKIEVTHDEPVLLAAPARPVAHGYGEAFDAAVRTYSLEEICAEKLRATRQTQQKVAARGWSRSRARDYY